MGRARILTVVLVAIVAGCATAPKTKSERMSLQAAAENTVADMRSRDPSLQMVMDRAAGYIVFPSVAQGGFIVGGASGNGVIYEGGRMVGFAQLSRGSLGLQAGGQKLAELIVVRDPQTLERIRAGSFDFGGQASAVALRSGAAGTTSFSNNGVAVFVDTKGGAMLNLSLTGQRIRVTG
jgi:lipid-binding SYLF domain-containing protein